MLEQKGASPDGVPSLPFGVDLLLVEISSL